jgi:hypothetical protein
MADDNETRLSQEQKQLLSKLIKTAATKLPADAEVKALGFGRNFRVNVLEALRAAFHTTKACITTAGCILAGSASPLEILEIAGDGYHAVIATCGALAESMTELVYTACVYLSSLSAPVSEAEFKSGLTEFLDSAKAAELPWYMGMTRSRVQKALAELRTPDGFSDLLKKLQKDNWLIEKGGKLAFKPRHVTLGIKAG